MPADHSSHGLVIGGVAALRDALATDSPAWPDPAEVDAAGAQLLAAAIRSGIDIPETIRTAPAVRDLWRALALDEVLPLDGQT